MLVTSGAAVDLRFRTTKFTTKREKHTDARASTPCTGYSDRNPRHSRGLPLLSLLLHQTTEGSEQRQMPERRHLVLATVTGIPDTHVTYPCCLCCYTKLLKDQNKDSWWCCKCGQSCTSDQVEWRYRLALTITDRDTLSSVCLFGRMLDQFFGKTATQFKKYLQQLESTCDQSEQLLKRAIEQTFIGQAYYFGFKTSGVISSKSVRLQDVVHNTGPKSQGPQEKLPHMVAFQILPSTNSAPVTVLDLLHLIIHGDNSRGNSATQTQRLPFQEVQVQGSTTQLFSPITRNGVKKTRDTVLWDSFKSEKGEISSCASYVSMTGSSFGQETALLSCDLSKSVESSYNVRYRQNNSGIVRSISKYASRENDSLYCTRSRRRARISSDSTDKLSGRLSLSILSHGCDSALSSNELETFQSSRLDSSGYVSLEKMSTHLEQKGPLSESELNSKKCSMQNSWNKENIECDMGVNIDPLGSHEDDPFSGCLDDSSLVLVWNHNGMDMCSGDRVQKSNDDDVRNDKAAETLGHPLESSVKTTRVSSRSNPKSGVTQDFGCQSRCTSIESANRVLEEQHNTGNKIKDMSKQFTCSKIFNSGRGKSSCENRTTSNLSTVTSGMGLPDNREDSARQDQPDIYKDPLVFPESEDMWAYLGDEEEFSTMAESRQQTNDVEQSKGDNNTSDTADVEDTSKTDSDETFDECFDPEFLNLDGSDTKDDDDDDVDDYKLDNTKLMEDKTVHNSVSDEDSCIATTKAVINEDTCDWDSEFEAGTEIYNNTQGSNSKETTENTDKMCEIPDNSQNKFLINRENSNSTDASGQSMKVVTDDCRNDFSDFDVSRSLRPSPLSCEDAHIDTSKTEHGRGNSEEFGNNATLNNLLVCVDILEKKSTKRRTLKLTNNVNNTSVNASPGNDVKELCDHIAIDAPQGQSMPDSEDLCAYMDETFGQDDSQQTFNISELHQNDTHARVDSNRRESGYHGDGLVRSEEMCVKLNKNSMTSIPLYDRANVHQSTEHGLINECENEMDKSKLQTSFHNENEEIKDISTVQTNYHHVLPYSEDIFESVFDSTFKETGTKNAEDHNVDEQYVENFRLKCTNVPEEKNRVCNIQNLGSDLENESLLMMQDSFVPANAADTGEELHVTSGVQDVQLSQESNVSGGNKTEELFSFNVSSDLFGCSVSSVAVCNDTYSQSTAFDKSGKKMADLDDARESVSLTEVKGDNYQEDDEKTKMVQFARRLSSVKTIQLIDIEMKIRQKPSLHLPLMPKSCLKARVNSSCTPLRMKLRTKGSELSKVFSLNKQEKFESQDICSCSTISEKSCEMDGPFSARQLSCSNSRDLSSCDDPANCVSQELFTPSPVQMSESMSSDIVLGSASCKRFGKKFKFPWTKKPLMLYRTLMSTPVEDCGKPHTNNYHVNLVSPTISQEQTNSFAQNSASLFFDSFDDLHVSTSTHSKDRLQSLAELSSSFSNQSKRKYISPVCVGCHGQLRTGQSLASGQTGEIALDEGSPDLFSFHGNSERSCSSAGMSGYRSSSKSQRSNTNINFPAKRLFLD